MERLHEGLHAGACAPADGPPVANCRRVRCRRRDIHVGGRHHHEEAAKRNSPRFGAIRDSRIAFLGKQVIAVSHRRCVEGELDVTGELKRATHSSYT